VLLEDDLQRLDTIELARSAKERFQTTVMLVRIDLELRLSKYKL
jgi:hypothetical protein